MAVDIEVVDMVSRMIDERLATCRTEVEGRLNLMHTDMAQLREEFHDFRIEMHTTTVDMSQHLSRIADHLEKLADLPEAWTNFKGFLGFMKWLKDYWFVFVLGGAAVLASLYLAAKSFGLLG